MEETNIENIFNIFKKSPKIRDQGNFGDCFSYAQSRFIRKLITNILIKERPDTDDIFTEENIDNYFNNLHDYINSIYGCEGGEYIILALLINDLLDENDVEWHTDNEKNFFYDKTKCTNSVTCNYISQISLNNVNITKNFEKFYYLLPLEIREKLSSEEYIKILNSYDISVYNLLLDHWDITIIPPPILLKILDDGYYAVFNSELHSTCMIGYKLLKDGTYNFIIKNSWGENWEQDYSLNNYEEDYSINNNEEESYKNKIQETIDNIKNDTDYKIPYTNFENNDFGPYFTNAYIQLNKSNEFEKLGFLNIQTTIDVIMYCIKMLHNYYNDISKKPNFFKYFYEHLIIHNLSNNISESQKTVNYLEWIDDNNRNLKKYYERNTSFKDPDYNNNRTFILKFNEYLLYIINVNHYNLSYFFNSLKKLYNINYIENAKKNYKKQFEFTKGVINMNNQYHKSRNKPSIKLSLPNISKKNEIKKILNTKNNEINIINKEYEMYYKGDYYEEKNYKIFHGNGVFIIKENNNILFYCIGIFENGWIKKGIIYYLHKNNNNVHAIGYVIEFIDNDKLHTLIYKDDESFRKYRYIIRFKIYNKKITDVNIVEQIIQENIINEDPEIKKVLSFTEPFNKGGKRRKTTKRNRYRKRKLRTKKQK